MEGYREVCETIAKRINVLGDFCGIRDVPLLNKDKLVEKYGFNQADVMVLFGGSIICGGDVLAEAMRQNIAKKYIIVGGAGHTTQTLRDWVHAKYPQIDTEEKPEAIVFNEYLKYKYGLEADYLEVESTNCGNNITLLLSLLDERHIKCDSIILVQDASMQRRMAATLRKYRPDITIINYAAYAIHIQEKEGFLCYVEDIEGMWDVDRYISLLMGEIPRLTDDGGGYGPLGKGYIAHEEIPPSVEMAFTYLQGKYSHLIRKANPEYANIKK